MKYSPYPLVLFVVAGCSSSPVKTIESSGNRSAPAWTEQQTYEEGSKTYYVGSAVVESGSSSACLIVSDEKALSEPARALVNQFIDQSTVIESSDEPSAKRVISSLRNERPTIEGLQIVDRYSALVRVESQGFSRVERRCFSLASASTSRVQAAVQALARKLRGDYSGLDQSLESIAEAQRKTVK